MRASWFDPTVDVALGVAPVAIEKANGRLAEALERLPAPIYTTDGQGCAIFFNQACLDFAAHQGLGGTGPRCLNWQLYTGGGEPLPGNDRLMREMIRHRLPLHGITAVAERPNGSRSRYRPFPTPLFDGNGEAVGAVNLLIDIDDRSEIIRLVDLADRCRRLARGIANRQTLETLAVMADEYEAEARVLTSLN